MVSPPSEPHSEKAHSNSPPQINLAFKAKGPDQDPGTTQPEGNSTHLTFFPGGGAHPWHPPQIRQWVDLHRVSRRVLRPVSSVRL